MAVMTDAPVRPGDTLAGKYRVERILGAGNMGVVVAATHISLGKLVALKFMLPGKAAHPHQLERFEREARAAAQLKSQHVAHVLDMGTLESGAPFTVMEFLEGQDLAALLEERGPLPVEEAVEYMLQVCEAVGEAHAAGIVHRDLKPANLFLTRDVSGAPCVKVLDFGISKFSGALTLTQDMQALGSPLYMSPEQMNASKHVDARSDIWALGVVLYELVACKTPFDAETIAQLCGRVFMGQPTPLSEHRNNAPPGLEAVILRCLEKDREQRWPNVAELAAALAPHAPAPARVYAARVARVLGGKAPNAPSVPELAPSEGINQAPPAEKQPSAATATTKLRVDVVPVPATDAPPQHTTKELFTGSDPAMVLNQSSGDCDPALAATKSDPAQRQGATEWRAKPPARWGLILSVALVTLAVSVALWVGLRLRGPGADPPPGPGVSTQRPVQALDPPTSADPPNKGAPEVTPAPTGTASQASGLPPAADASAPHVVSPPSIPNRSPRRDAGGDPAHPPSNVSAQPSSYPLPATQPSHRPMF